MKNRATMRAWRVTHPKEYRERQRQYYEDHRAVLQQYGRNHYHAKPDLYRDQYLRRVFGITLKEVEALLASQGGACAICKSLTPGGRGTWHVDHLHVEGYDSLPPEKKRTHIRGLLCHACNTGLTEHFEKHAAAVLSYLCSRSR